MQTNQWTEQQHNAVNKYELIKYGYMLGVTTPWMTDLDGSAYNHDGVMQRSLSLLRELLGSAPQNDSARLRLRTALKDVIPADRRGCEPVQSSGSCNGHLQVYGVILPLSSNLDLLEDFTLSQDAVGQVTHGGLDGAPAGLEDTLHTINVSVNYKNTLGGLNNNIHIFPTTEYKITVPVKILHLAFLVN